MPGQLSPSVATVTDLLDKNAGIILNVMDLGKPLWFSDVRLAAAACSQTTSAIRGMLSERAVRASTPRMPAASFYWAAPHGSGVSYDAADALVKAVGEVVERYCSQILNPGKHRVRTESHRALSATANVPLLESFNILGGGPSPAGRSTIRPLDADSVVRWIECKRIGDGEPAWMPLSTAVFGTHAEPAERICEDMGTGFACHESLEGALLGGLCEVVERDAIMGMWLRRLSPPRIDVDSCRAASPLVRRAIQELDATWFTLCINDLTSDFGLPVFFVTALADGPPHAMVGAGCHPDASRALAKALLELMQSVSMFVNVDFDQVKTWRHLDADETLREMHDHALRYGAFDLRERFEFLVKAPLERFTHTSSFENHPRDLAAAVSGIRKAGYDALYLDLTIPEIERVGLTVAKVMIPGAIPLSNLLDNTPYGCPRLGTYHRIFPRVVAYHEDLNPSINPFP